MFENFTVLSNAYARCERLCYAVLLKENHTNKWLVDFRSHHVWGSGSPSSSRQARSLTTNRTDASPPERQFYHFEHVSIGQPQRHR